MVTSKDAAYRVGDLVEVSNSTWFYDHYVDDDASFRRTGDASFFSVEPSLCLVVGVNSARLSTEPEGEWEECLLLNAEMFTGWVHVKDLHLIARGH